MEAYIGQINIVPWKTIPSGWMACSGQILKISNYQALFSLIGTAYGGDGKTTFQLPNLNGRVIMGGGINGGNLSPGKSGGATTVTLSQTQMPTHQHQFQVSTQNGNQATPAGNICAAVATGQLLYGPMTSNPTNMNTGLLESYGGGQAHTNMQPYIALSFIICVSEGLYPPSP